jgi:hypothetical protein
MKHEKGHTWVVVAAILLAGSICATAASICKAMCHVPYLQLGAPASSPRQAA